jgi:hypothetical protein
MGVRRVGQILRASGINVVHKVENGLWTDIVREVSRCWGRRVSGPKEQNFSMKNLAV